jgi:hypothetical protein
MAQLLKEKESLVMEKLKADSGLMANSKTDET